MAMAITIMMMRRRFIVTHGDGDPDSRASTGANMLETRVRDFSLLQESTSTFRLHTTVLRSSSTQSSLKRLAASSLGPSERKPSSESHGRRFFRPAGCCG